MTATGPALADWIRPASLAPAFAPLGRLHVPDVLEAGFARTLAAALAEAPWSRSLTVEWDPLESTCRHASLSIL